MAATYTLISSQVLGSTSNSITFSSIPQTFKDLKLSCSVRTDDASRNTGKFNVTFNGDTTTNYSITSLLYNNGSPYAFNQVNSASTYTSVSQMATAGNTTTTFSNVDMYIPSYSTTGTKQISSFQASENNDSTREIMSIEANLYRGTLAITSLNITSGSANYVAGSSFYLYGIKNS
jgi:hypothetical protein